MLCTVEMFLLHLK